MAYRKKIAGILCVLQQNAGTVILGLVFWFWVWSFVLFDYGVTHLPCCTICRPQDALVVFTGGTGRVQKGLALFEAGWAPRLFVSGACATRKMVLGSRDHTNITLGYNAKHTLGNVRETIAWLRKEKLRTAYLVTADYHTPRSLMLLRQSMPEGHFIPCPLRTPPSRRLFQTFLEYHKCLVSRFWTKDKA